tara:strand:+ start:217 stop:876 length:660 start_codon:yes stop_codon:yes gene_type:complete
LENHYKTRKHQDKLEKDVDISQVINLRKQVEDQKAKIRELTFENDKLRNQLEKKNTETISVKNIKQYNNCTINNIQFNLNINAHGSENWDYLKDEIIPLMKGVHTCIPEMVKRIHFNKDHPENHNLKFPNKKLPTIKAFDGEEWKTLNKKDVIESLITNLVYRLEEEYGGDFRISSTKFIQELWEKKTLPIISEHKIDNFLRKQVEYSIIDGQNDLRDN